MNYISQHRAFCENKIIISFLLTELLFYSYTYTWKRFHFRSTNKKMVINYTVGWHKRRGKSLFMGIIMCSRFFSQDIFLLRVVFLYASIELEKESLLLFFVVLYKTLWKCVDNFNFYYNCSIQNNYFIRRLDVLCSVFVIACEFECRMVTSLFLARKLTIDKESKSIEISWFIQLCFFQ